jgi:ADP-heptose:LPS heptosyltransferase
LAPAVKAWRGLVQLPRFSFVFDMRSRITSVWLARSLLRHERYFTVLPYYFLSAAKPPGRIRRPARRWARFLSLAEQPIGARLDPRGAVPCAPAALAAAADILPPGPSYVGLGPGSRELRRNWRVERFVQCANLLAADGLTPVILIGPYEDDAPLCDGSLARGVRVVRLSDFPATATVGAIDPALALCSRLSAMVANDAGMGHIAGAMGVPVVSLFGPTNADKQAPFCPDGITVRASDFGGRSMNAIPVAPVHRAALTLLSRAQPSGPSVR